MKVLIQVFLLWITLILIFLAALAATEESLRLGMFVGMFAAVSAWGVWRLNE